MDLTEFGLPTWRFEGGEPLPQWKPTFVANLMPIQIYEFSDGTSLLASDREPELWNDLLKTHGGPEGLMFVWGPGDFEFATPVEYAPSTVPGVIFVRRRSS